MTETDRLKLEALKRETGQSPEAIQREERSGPGAARREELLECEAWKSLGGAATSA